MSNAPCVSSEYSHRILQQAEQLLADLHRMFAGLAVDREISVSSFQVLMQAIDAPHVVKNRRYGGFAPRVIVAPELHGAARAHDGFVARHPLGVRRLPADSNERANTRRNPMLRDRGRECVELARSMVAIMRAWPG